MLVTAAFISTAVASAMTAMGVTIGTGLATAIAVFGSVTSAIIYGGLATFAMSIVQKNRDFGSMSGTYKGVLQTQTDQNLPVPLLYGTVKLAGNRIWQDENNDVTIKRIVAFAEGEICDYSDIRLNDIPIEEIRGISVKRYYGTPEQEIDSIISGASHEERAEKVGSLKDVAYLAITVPRSNKIDINYNLTAVVKGRKIRVYNSLNNYVVKYSENPAWVMFDFLTCYNGLGLACDNYGQIDENLIRELFDLESFIESAAFCDELLESPPRKDKEGNTIEGEMAPRFTFNMIFDSQTSARTLIDEIYRSCRGGLFIKDGKLQFKIDKQEPVSKVFTAQDIIKGSEVFQTIPKEEHYDILKCTYISPDHEWQKVEATAELPEYRDGVPIEHSINMYSVTNFAQASRLAWYYVNSKRIQPYFGSFKTDYKASDLEVGDVIRFDSLLMGLKKYPVKITSIIDEGGGIFEINWRNYDERLYSDELGSKEPRVLVSTIKDIAAIPEDVQNFNVIQSNNLFNFVWKTNQDSTNTYEIRMGENWENSSVIKSGISENNYSHTIPTTGLFKFWIKASNGYNYSEHATLDVISVDSIPNLNEIVKIDVLQDLLGVFDNNIKSYRNQLKLKPNNILWHNEEENWRNDNTYYSNSGYWGASVFSEGVYESQIFDIGNVLTSLVSFDYLFKSIDTQNTVLIEWSYSEDNINFTDWEIINPGTYTFRYCKFKITLRAYNNIQTILTKFVVSVDVPDKDLDLNLEINNPSGLILNYDFIEPPSIVATVNDDSNAYIVITQKTNKFAQIKAYTNAGQLTTCKLSLHAKGY